MAVTTSQFLAGEGVSVWPRTFDEAATRSFFVVMLAMACLMPAQNDTWWHLRVGQEMWTRRALMFTDEFSFTVYGAAWPNHEWLSQVLFYATYKLGGLPLLTFLAAVCVTVSLALSWRLMAGSPLQRLLLTGLAMVSIAPAWTIRPHIFTLMLLPAVINLAVRRCYWPLPLLFLVWANLHGGVALGMVALAAMIAGQFYVSGFSRVKPLLAATAGSFAATCITPLGGSFWLKIPQAVHNSRLNMIMEWQTASLSDPAYLAFWATAATLLATTWAGRRQLRSAAHAPLVAVALAFLPFALRSRRNIPPFLVVALPAVTWNLVDRLERWKARPRIENPTMSAALFAVCTVACVAIVATAWSQPAARLRWQPIPQSVVNEVEACGDRVFNGYEDGGYLIWFAPDVRVFIDSRHDPYPFAFVQEYIRMERT